MSEKQVIPINLGMVKAFLIKGEKYILVDTGMLQSTGKIMDFLLQNKINPQEISLIIITHGHSDHFGGAAKMKALTGAKVLIHKAEEEYLENGNSAPAQGRILLARVIMKLMSLVKGPKLEGVKADIVTEGNFDLRPYGVNGKVLHTPGHSVGSISVLLENGDAVVGDIINGKSKNGESSAKYPFIWSDINSLKDSLKMLLDNGAKVFYNAHGDACDDSAVKKLLEENIE